MKTPRLTTAQRALLIASVAGVYAVNFWPSTQVRNAGLAALGNPAYVGGKGIFLPHLLFYSTLTAAAAALAWWGFVRGRVLPAPQLSRPSSGQLSAGVVGGLVALVGSLAFVYFVFSPGMIRWIDPSPWKIAGNVFSNFYEEFVFRGFVLVALGAAIGFWPAAILSSVMWGYTHHQYPLALQLLIAVMGVYFCGLTRRTQSLWTPYAAHLVLDLLADSLIG
jgi:membrane protease YdiL (CAAX protease family)